MEATKAKVYYTGRSKYRGITRRKYRRAKALEGTNSTPGLAKGDNCKTDGLQKALTKYPRACKTMPLLYISCMKKQASHWPQNSVFN